MRDPIDLPGFTTEVVYPASIFSLERHENVSYERFAYNVFREAITALQLEGLPVRLIVRFAPSGQLPAWAINAALRRDPSKPNALTVEIPELLPTMLMLFTKIVSPHFGAADPKELRASIQSFADIASSAVRDYRDIGIAGATRRCFTTAEISFPDAFGAMERFDALTFLIANHEVAHIYIGQLKDPPPPDDKPAFEYLADIVASEWLFRKFIHLTPDSPEYLEMRRVSSRAEALFENCKSCLDSHFSLLILMGLAGSQQSQGRFHLEAGDVHPGGFSRFWIQVHWLLGAIETEISKELGADLYRELDAYFMKTYSTLVESNLISRNSLGQVMDLEEVKQIARAAQIAEDRNIKEVLPGLDFLKSRLNSAAKTRTSMRPGSSG